MEHVMRVRIHRSTRGIGDMIMMEPLFAMLCARHGVQAVELYLATRKAKATGGSGDGVASPGERVYPRIRLKNVGTADIRGVRVHFTRNTPVRMPPGWRRSTTRGLWVGRTTANR